MKKHFRGIRIVKEWLRISKWIKQNPPIQEEVDQDGLSHVAGYVARLVKPSSPGGLLFIAPQKGKGVTVMREAYQLYIQESVHLLPSGRRVKQLSNPIYNLYWIIFARKRVHLPPAEPEMEQAIRRLFAALNIAPDEDSIHDFNGYADAMRHLRYPISNSVEQATNIVQRLLREVYHVQEADGLFFIFLDFNYLDIDTRIEYDCKRAIAIDSGDVRARENLAYIYLQQQRYAEAEQEYKRVLATHPNNMNARQCLAYAYLHQQRYAEAEQEYNQILAASPDNTHARDNLACIYIQQQRYARAVKEFKRVLATDSIDIYAHENLAYLYDKQRHYVEAEEENKRILALVPNDKDAQVRLANAYFGQQRYAEAEQEYNRVLALDPKNIYARNGLADLAHIDAERERKQWRSRNIKKSSH